PRARAGDEPPVGDPAAAGRLGRGRAVLRVLLRVGRRRAVGGGRPVGRVPARDPRVGPPRRGPLADVEGPCEARRDGGARGGGGPRGGGGRGVSGRGGGIP